MRIFSFLMSQRKIVIQVEETIGGVGWDGDYSMMQWLYVRTEEDMNGQNLIASEQIENDADSEKEILDDMTSEIRVISLVKNFYFYFYFYYEHINW